MKTPVLQRMEDVVARASYPGFTFECGQESGYYWLRILCDGTCAQTGDPLSWKGRKWRLSRHMTDGEIVQTAWLAVKTAIEHEARERFTYRGVAVFDPHYNIEALVSLGQEPRSIRSEG